MPGDVVVVDFILPDLGEGLEEAEIVSWLVPEGAEVTRDQPFVAVETDKSVVELSSPITGRLGSHGAAEGEVVRVGSVLARFERLGSSAESAAAPNRSAAAAPPPDMRPPVVVDGVSPKGRRRPLAAPTVRRRATELGIDLSDVPPTGPGGRVLADDVARYAAASAAPEQMSAGEAPALPMQVGPIGRVVEEQTIPVRGVRKATAAITAQSWSTIPHVTQMDLVDATELLALRDRAKASSGRRLGVLPFAVMAVARALRRFPSVNATFDAEMMVIRHHAVVNVAIAIATDDGVIVPVIRNADSLDLVSIATEVERFAGAARSRAVTTDELRGATFTITNFGVYGGGFGLPIIRPPEVGILGLGAIKKRPLVVGDDVLARPALPCVFAADHRVIDGEVLIGFLEHVMTSLADPISMLLTGPAA